MGAVRQVCGVDGSGSFGDVFRVSSKRPLVVKICEVTDTYCESIVEREVEIMRACDHPNVLNLLETIKWEQYVYLFMDLCVPLPVFLRTKLSEEQLGEFAAGLVAGVEHLHERRVMHRDLKPQNLLVRHGAIVIADFGLSIQLPEDKWEAGREGEAYTREVCTRWWRPPEVPSSSPTRGGSTFGRWGAFFTSSP